MNRPGTADGNWGFRLAPAALDAGVAGRLRELTATYGPLVPRLSIRARPRRRQEKGPTRASVARRAGHGWRFAPFRRARSGLKSAAPGGKVRF
jgi:hypothetical protein